MDFKYPMKPIRVDDQAFRRLDLSNYTMEPKYDGFRLLLVVNNGIKLFTRHKTSLQIPHNVREELLGLKLPEGTILDGEIWNDNKRGAWTHDQNSECTLSFWDIMMVKYKDLSNMSIEDRRNHLKTLIPSGSNIKRVPVYPASLDLYLGIKDDAIAHKMINKSKSGYIHGVVLKKGGSPRRDHVLRSKEHADWLKVVLF